MIITFLLKKIHIIATFVFTRILNGNQTYWGNKSAGKSETRRPNV